MSVLLGGRSAALFLRRYWQKRPLLIRGAFPAFESPLTPDELAGLACEEGVESRLVLERGGRRPWQVEDGPQDPRRLRRLPRTHWTLLVQGVDRLLPAVSALVEPFRFVPDWRIDDVMVSVAPRFGSVGPHVDSYDVFLLQGLGRRRWSIDPGAAPDFRPGLDLRILRRFAPAASWVLEPGDMLYLPPGVAHHGVALEEGLTYSIGFRAPTGRELVAALLRPHARDIFFRDPNRRSSRHSAEIARSDLDALRRLALAETKRRLASEFEAAVGELLTEPKHPVAEAGHFDARSLRRHLAAGRSLLRAPGARLAFLRRRGGLLLFAEGRSFPLPKRLAFAGPLLTETRRFDSAALRPHHRAPGFAELLADLVSAGAFIWGQ